MLIIFKLENMTGVCLVANLVARQY